MLYPSPDDDDDDFDGDGDADEREVGEVLAPLPFRGARSFHHFHDHSFSFGTNPPASSPLSLQ